jgi:hypothetical protein
VNIPLDGMAFGNPTGHLGDHSLVEILAQSLLHNPTLPLLPCKVYVSIQHDHHDIALEALTFICLN